MLQLVVDFCASLKAAERAVKCTSDEKGIRHPLLDDGTAKVDETDALFMLGACAAFVSYLINKARSAKLLDGKPAGQ
jgi:hypothetical protein